jgi:hypothetical protein
VETMQENTRNARLTFKNWQPQTRFTITTINNNKTLRTNA